MVILRKKIVVIFRRSNQQGKKVTINSNDQEQKVTINSNNQEEKVTNEKSGMSLSVRHKQVIDYCSIPRTAQEIILSASCIIDIYWRKLVRMEEVAC